MRPSGYDVVTPAMTWWRAWRVVVVRVREMPSRPEPANALQLGDAPTAIAMLREHDTNANDTGAGFDTGDEPVPAMP